MKKVRTRKYRIYPSKAQEAALNSCLYFCKVLWNLLLACVKSCYEKTGKFPAAKQLYSLAKGFPVFSQVAQDVVKRLLKALKGVISRKKTGQKCGFPRFKPLERMKSFTYPQFGFKLSDRLELSGIGSVAIKQHRDIGGKPKTLTIKKSPSGKWHAIFTVEIDECPFPKKQGPKAGFDLGIEYFAYLSDGETIDNPRHLKRAELKLTKVHKRLSNKKRGSKNRKNAKAVVASAYENLANSRKDFLHKVSRKLAEKYSFLAMEDLNVKGLSRGFLAKHVLDCSWAEFSSMLRYKAEEAGCEVVLVKPAHTTQTCSSCGLVRKKPLAERWHACACGASMPRDLNAAKNILERATSGTMRRSRDGCEHKLTSTAGTAGCKARAGELSSQAARERKSLDGEETSTAINRLGKYLQ